MSISEKLSSNSLYQKVYIMALVGGTILIQLFWRIYTLLDSDILKAGRWSGNITHYIIILMAAVAISKRDILISSIYVIGVTISATLVFLLNGIKTYEILGMDASWAGIHWENLILVSLSYLIPIVMGIWGMFVVLKMNAEKKASSNMTSEQSPQTR